jgi:hypothetical protein
LAGRGRPRHGRTPERAPSREAEDGKCGGQPDQLVDSSEQDERDCAACDSKNCDHGREHAEESMSGEGDPAGGSGETNGRDCHEKGQEVANKEQEQRGKHPGGGHEGEPRCKPAGV